MVIGHITTYIIMILRYPHNRTRSLKEETALGWKLLLLVQWNISILLLLSIWKIEIIIFNKH